jgi:hypothetical protein
VAVFIFLKLVWRIEFFDLSIIKDHDFVALNNGLKSVSNYEHRLIFELFLHEILNLLLCDYIDISSSLIKYNDLSLSQSSTTDA